MSQRVIQTVTDDLDGSEGAETISFSLRGVGYEIDLSDKNGAALDEALAKYIEAGRKVSGPKPAARSRSNGSRSDTQKIRVWAADHGHTLAARGRIPANVMKEYHEAGN